MTISLAIMLLCMLVVILTSLLFVFHPKYEVGALGVLGLAMLSVAAITRLDGLLDEIASGYEIEVYPRALIAWIGSALFFGQLAYRFIRRCGLLGKFARHDYS